MPEQMLADRREAAGPEPTSIYVHATSVGHRMVEVLSGPPFVLKFLNPHPEERFQRSMHGWGRELPRLRERDWQVDLTGVESPVALQGYLPTGEDFYLRCRHDHCRLEIDEDSANWWRFEIQYEHAGWIEPDEAARVLHELHTTWLNRTPGDHGNCCSSVAPKRLVSPPGLGVGDRSGRRDQGGSVRKPVPARQAQVRRKCRRRAGSRGKA